MKNQKKLGRNDLCWCSSGIKFKKCHGSRNPPKTPPQVIGDRILKNAFKTGKCLYPGQAECGRPVRSHTIQRSGPLRRIVDNENRVSKLELDLVSEALPTWKDKKVGWRFASTFPGFCAKHDSEVFKCLESEEFSGYPEQCFLVGYRAICHELQRKKALDGSRWQTDALLSHVRGSIPIESEEFDANVALAYKELSDKKRRLDAIFHQKDWSQWESRVVKFSGSMDIVGAGSTTPELTVEGRQVQSAADCSQDLQNLTIGLVEVGERFAFVLGWERCQEAPRLVADSIVQASVERIPQLLAQFLFLQLENIFFSEQWWQSLSQKKKALVMELSDTLEETVAPQFPNEELVSWKLEAVEVV